MKTKRWFAALAVSAPLLLAARQLPVVAAAEQRLVLAIESQRTP